MSIIASVTGPLLSVFLVVLLTVLPLYPLTRRLSSDPLVRLALAVSATVLIIYLLVFGSYLLALPMWLPVLFCTAGSAAAAVFLWFEARGREAGTDMPWAGVAVWCAVSLWQIAIQMHIVNYGPLNWLGDWYEHYERALFFMDRLPASRMFLNETWSLAARGPLYNTAAAAYMKLLGRDFCTYQIVASCLNALPVLPLALLLRDVAGLRSSRALAWAAVLLGIAPFATQHEIYPWTKSFTLAFVLGAIHLYRLGLRRRDLRITTWSFSLFALGILAHYLVIVYAAFFAVHFCFVMIRQKCRWRSLFAPVTTAAVLVATWFGFTIVRFGITEALTSNTTMIAAREAVSDSPREAPSMWGRAFLGNMITTTLPYTWRGGFDGLGAAPAIRQFDPRTPPPYLPSEDQFNLRNERLSGLAANPCSLLGSLGYAGIIGLLATIAIAVARRPVAATVSYLTWRFWLVFCVFGIPLNILFAHDYFPNGTAHLNLQPYVALAVVLMFRWLRDAHRLFTIPLAGVFLIESSLVTWALIALQRRRPAVELGADGQVVITGLIDVDMNCVNNWVYKLQQGAVFLSDRLGDVVWPASLLAAVLASGLGVWAVSRTRR